MPDTRLEYLFYCYTHNLATVKEEEELMELIAQSENQEAVKKLIDALIDNTGSEMILTGQVSAAILENILKKDDNIVIPSMRKSGFRLWVRVAAAMILFTSAIFAYILLSQKRDGVFMAEVTNEKHSPIIPGGNKATLTTSDGTVIILDSVQNGTISNVGSTQVIKKGGMIMYDVSASFKPGAPVVYNTLSTPKGGQYQVVLPDGSKVWLNASSSLHFPSAFTGSKREVELTGEGYFEVAKNKKKPFQVIVGNMKVNVLGTHFNINAYAEESSIKTSLLEGSVHIAKGSVSNFLKPGQQATLKTGDDKVKITNADMDQVMAWKNGLFQFDGDGITTIMREIGRWYNVEVLFEDTPPTRRFRGKISRDAQLSDVLKIIGLSGVNFSVVGNRIIVK
ncbi:MAG: FecR family protein [Ginsengibacter sp.]